MIVLLFQLLKGIQCRQNVYSIIFSIPSAFPTKQNNTILFQATSFEDLKTTESIEENESDLETTDAVTDDAEEDSEDAIPTQPLAIQSDASPRSILIAQQRQMEQKLRREQRKNRKRASSLLRTYSFLFFWTVAMGITSTTLPFKSMLEQFPLFPKRTVLHLIHSFQSQLRMSVQYGC